MYNYECKRCFHKTKQKIEMIRHLNKKNICTRSIESYKYNDDDLTELSLVNINNCNKFINKKYICKYCNNIFSRNFTLNRHIKSCKIYKKNNIKEYIDFLLNYISKLENYNNYSPELKILIKIIHINRIKEFLFKIKPELSNKLDDDEDYFINIDFSQIINKIIK
jgi:uncharacterized Zn-finger protein